jgi:hypothetical protein
VNSDRETLGGGETRLLYESQPELGVAKRTHIGGRTRSRPKLGSRKTAAPSVFLGSGQPTYGGPLEPG